MQTIFVVNQNDNVGVAVSELKKEQLAETVGAGNPDCFTVLDEIKTGHKVALKDIKIDSPIMKYGIVIGKATSNISKGSWVHLHNMKSQFDERSSQIDPVNGIIKDTVYE